MDFFNIWKCSAERVGVTQAGEDFGDTLIAAFW